MQLSICDVRTDCNNITLVREATGEKISSSVMSLHLCEYILYVYIFVQSDSEQIYSTVCIMPV